MIKQVILLRRRPDVMREEFERRWVGDHRAMAARLSACARTSSAQRSMWEITPRCATGPASCSSTMWSRRWRYSNQTSGSSYAWTRRRLPSRRRQRDSSLAMRPCGVCRRWRRTPDRRSQPGNSCSGQATVQATVQANLADGWPLRPWRYDGASAPNGLATALGMKDPPARMPRSRDPAACLASAAPPVGARPDLRR